MAMAEVNYPLSGGGGDMTATLSQQYSGVASVTINCNVGDIVICSFARSAQVNWLWNGQTWNASPDSLGTIAQGTNNNTFIYKASQTTNTFGVQTGTMSGGYTVVSCS